jgi:hypothetical protein
LHGRRAVDEDSDLLAGVVPQLERRAGLNRDDALGRELDALRRLAEQHGQGPREDDEDLLLRVVSARAVRGTAVIRPQS